MIPFVVAKIRIYIDIYCIYYIYAYITRIQGVFSCPGQLNSESLTHSVSDIFYFSVYNDYNEYKDNIDYIDYKDYKTTITTITTETAI